jgi:hypothetical protein
MFDVREISDVRRISKVPRECRRPESELDAKATGRREGVGFCIEPHSWAGPVLGRACLGPGLRGVANREEAIIKRFGTATPNQHGFDV